MVSIPDVVLAVKSGRLSATISVEGFKVLTWNGRQVSDEEALILIRGWHYRIVAALVAEAKQVAAATWLAVGAPTEGATQ